jgi:hypothetical protein
METRSKTRTMAKNNSEDPNLSEEEVLTPISKLETVPLSLDIRPRVEMTLPTVTSLTTPKSMPEITSVAPHSYQAPWAVKPELEVFYTGNPIYRVAGFIKGCEEFFALAKSSPESWTGLALKRLREEAKIWGKTISSHDSWESFTYRLELHFESPMRRREQQDNLKRVEQRADEDAFSFLLNKKDLATVLLPKESSEELAELFFELLNERDQLRVGQSGWSNLEGLMEITKRLKPTKIKTQIVVAGQRPKEKECGCPCNCSGNQERTNTRASVGRQAPKIDIRHEPPPPFERPINNGPRNAPEGGYVRGSATRGRGFLNGRPRMPHEYGTRPCQICRNGYHENYTCPDYPAWRRNQEASRREDQPQQ